MKKAAPALSKTRENAARGTAAVTANGKSDGGTAKGTAATTTTWQVPSVLMHAVVATHHDMRQRSPVGIERRDGAPGRPRGVADAVVRTTYDESHWAQQHEAIDGLLQHVSHLNTSLATSHGQWMTNRRTSGPFNRSMRRMLERQHGRSRRATSSSAAATAAAATRHERPAASSTATRSR